MKIYLKIQSSKMLVWCLNVSMRAQEEYKKVRMNFGEYEVFGNMYL